MMDFTTYTNEELVSMITDGNEAAYEQLFYNLRPIILKECEMYKGRMETYGIEDFLQEGMIVAWQIIHRGNFDAAGKGRFSTYFAAAYRKKLISIYRSFVLKNMILVEECEDLKGNITRIYGVADYAETYRKKKAEQQKRWYHKKKAQTPPTEKKPPMTREERSRKCMEYQRAYYAAHPEKLEERREKNRIAQRKRYAAKKAAKLAEMA